MEDAVIHFPGNDTLRHKVRSIHFSDDFLGEIKVSKNRGSSEGFLEFLEGPLTFRDLDNSFVFLCQSSERMCQVRKPLDKLIIKVSKTVKGMNISDLFRYEPDNDGFHFGIVYVNFLGCDNESQVLHLVNIKLLLLAFNL